MNFYVNFIFVYLCSVLCNKLFEAQVINKPPVQMNTTSGIIKGITVSVLKQTVEQYLGIPYAVPPVGSLRFAKPKPIEKPIEGIIDGTKPKNSCFQTPLPNLESISGIAEKSEDCLVLNIWCPQNKHPDQLKPVMFFVHGGALFFGSIFQTAYNGSVLATHDVVFVSANYRLGWFGFLYGEDESAPGNVGLYDQILALQWVRDNIHLFGGDKNQITLVSTSWAASSHIISPMTKGLFKRAILMSGAMMLNKDKPVVSKELALLKAKDLTKRFKCEDNDKWLQCLRRLDSRDNRWKAYSLVFPIDGTELIPIMPRKAFEQGKFNKDIDLLVGFTKDEIVMITNLLAKEILLANRIRSEDFHHYLDVLNKTFHGIDSDKLAKFYLNKIDLANSSLIRRRVYELTGDLTMKCSTYLFAKLYAQHSSPETNVYAFESTHKSDDIIPENIGLSNGGDKNFLFGHPLLVANSSAVDIEFTKEYMKLFTDFVKYGKPDPKWPKLVVGTRKQPVLRLWKELHTTTNKGTPSEPIKNNCNDIWKDYF